ncbi:hypothetical protein KAI68_01925 [bacterium]|nr:hypothetical protein [bacterium]
MDKESKKRKIEKIKIRGLVRQSGWIFLIWGIVVAIKGLLDAFLLNPPSEFISLDEWLRYAGFEIIYGIACLGVGILLFKFSRRVKEYVVRDKEE